MKKIKYYFLIVSLVILSFIYYVNIVRTEGSFWSEPYLVEINNQGNAFGPQVVMDDNGSALVVWFQYDGSNNNIWANNYDPTNGWGVPQLIENNDSGSALFVKLAMSGDGSAIAVWQQYDGNRYSIWANNYSYSNGWGESYLLEDTNYDSKLPEIAMNRQGDAIVTWQQQISGFDNIVANIYDASSQTWAGVQNIEANSGSAYFPQVFLSNSGQAMVVWLQYNGINYNIWANTYDFQTNNWGVAGSVESLSLNTTTSYPQVAMDDMGNATVVWGQYDGSVNNIWSNRYDIITQSWKGAQMIESNNLENSDSVQVKMDEEGNTFVVWQKRDVTSYNIWFNKYDVLSGNWTGATTLDNGDFSAVDPQIIVDNAGNIVVVWQQYDGTKNNILFSSCNSANQIWLVPKLLEHNDIGDAYHANIAVNNIGDMIVAWEQLDNGRHDVWVSLHEADVIESRHSISGKVWLDENKNGIKDELENIGLKNVEIKLYRDNNLSQNFDSDDYLTDTVVSDSLGKYSFDNLIDGSYIVVVNDASNSLNNDVINGSKTYGLTTNREIGFLLYNEDAVDNNFGFSVAKVTMIVDKNSISEDPSLGNITNVILNLSVATAFETNISLSYGGTAQIFYPVAIANIDYTKRDVVNISVGSKTSLFSIQAVQDSLQEYPEVFSVELAGVVNGTKDGVLKYTINIFDDSCTLDFGINNTAPKLVCKSTSSSSTNGRAPASNFSNLPSRLPEQAKLPILPIQSKAPIAPIKQTTITKPVQKQACGYVRDTRTKKINYACK